jgi:CubicO group peptidase (beta-lactamase class C family)
LQTHHIPAVGIAIIKDGKLTQAKTFGYLTSGQPSPTHTIFNVASLTKPVIALLTLKLVSRGQWQLDEPLSRYWIDPDVVNDPHHKKLTTRHILSHQTGFLNWRWLHNTKKLTFDFEPGTKFQYSGEGFEYLRRALEYQFKKPLDQLCDSLLFKPLGMTDSRLVWDQQVDTTRFAHSHDKEGQPSYKITKQQTPNAADDLLTTVEDYERFAAWVINGAGLPPALFAEMISPRATINNNSAMALSWELFTNLPNDEYAILHTGSDWGVKTLVILFPKSKQGLVVLTNGDNGMQLYDPLIRQSFGNLGKAFLKAAGE